MIGAEPLDLSRKLATAKTLKGPRMILAMAPCPVGWNYDPRETVKIGQLAVRTGIWPLKEYRDGRTEHTRVPHPRLPVEDYLSTQGRFRHLFEPARDEARIAEIQAGVDAYWREVEAGAA